MNKDSKISAISGVILAGGANKRFHGNIKSKIIIDGKSIISRILETIRGIFDEIIIVTNTPGEFAEYSQHGIVSDHFLNIGPLGGIHAALKASTREAVFVFAGDMPLIEKSIINRQIDFYRSIKCDVLIPRIDQYIEPLHAIYNRDILNSLEDYLTNNTDHAVREFFKKVNVDYLEFGDKQAVRNAFTNINSPADISIVEKILGIR